MPLTVHKYPMPLNLLQSIGTDSAGVLLSLQMPRGAQVLSIQAQNETPTLWALVNPSFPIAERWFCMTGTGYPLPDNVGAHLGTVQLAQGHLVIHVFEALSGA